MERKSYKNVIRIAIVLVVIGLIGIFLLFRSHMNSTLNEYTKKYLEDNVDAIAQTFYTKLDDQMVMLESQTRYFKDVDLTDYNAMKKTIISTKGIGAFNSIGVSSSTGATMDYNGKSAGNILLEDYFKEAMTGKNAISDPTDKGTDEDLVLAVPIKKGEDVVGIIYGSFDSKVLDSLVGTVRFTEDAANILISEEGDIIAHTADVPWITDDTKNLFDEIEGLDIQSGEKNVVYKFTKDGSDNIVVLTSIGVHDWYFATVIPESAVTEQNREVEKYVIIVIVEVVLVFIILMLIVFILNRRNKVMELTNERLMTVSEQAGDIILDYDYKSGHLTLQGDVSVIVPEKKDYYDSEDVAAILGRIHDEDEGLLEDLKNIASFDQETFTGEGRLWCVDERYRWFQVNITIVKSGSGKPSRLIGSVNDINDRMNRELDLAHQAETDALTGLTNKMSFEKVVDQAISELESDGSIALFIIDLDNFKAVNDKLGHATGDKLLTDVSKKLRIFFPGGNSIGRIGGDEFSAYMEFRDAGNRSQNLVRLKADHICKSIRTSYSNPEQTESVEIGCSVGIAIYPKDAKDFKTLYKRADQALYKSKKDGKGTYNFWTPDLAGVVKDDKEDKE